MANDKSFLTYNQQMKKLRNDKKLIVMELHTKYH